MLFKKCGKFGSNFGNGKGDASANSADVRERFAAILAEGVPPLSLLQKVISQQSNARIFNTEKRQER